MNIPDNPYILLTPGPLSTTKSVKVTMLKDWCTWDDDYKRLVQKIRKRLVRLGKGTEEKFTSILMQGSGTFSVESVIGTVIPDNGKLLVLINGAYGERIAKIARKLNIRVDVNNSGETQPPDLNILEKTLHNDPEITHVAVVHNETTTGILNPISKIGDLVKEYNKTYIVDAMSSFGGIEIDIDNLQIDFLISSANKCIQGVPGFGFVIARISEIKSCQGQARSLALDLFDQWKIMEEMQGKWRYTSPTHVVRAFYQALLELEEEGGVKARQRRYYKNQRCLVEGMRELGFRTLLPDKYHSPVITAFYYPESKNFIFKDFYQSLKNNGYVIYPGKVTDHETFRIGTIGNVTVKDIEKLISIIRKSNYVFV